MLRGIERKYWLTLKTFGLTKYENGKFYVLQGDEKEAKYVQVTIVNPKEWENGRFQYILTTDTYYSPKTLATLLGYWIGTAEFKHFMSIKDLQSDTHEYGDTYVIPHHERKS